MWEPFGGEGGEGEEEFPELEADPVQPVLAPPPGLVGGAPCAAGATTRQRGPGVTMRDDSGESSIQASTPKVACTARNRRSKADASCENLVKRRHVIGKRLTGDWARERVDVRRPARRASTTISGGKDNVTDIADPMTNTLEPLVGRSPPATAGQKAVVRARLNWAVPATR